MASKEAKARIAGGSASARHEFRMMRRDGSTVWVETVGSHIQWNGQSAALVFANDITSR
jgi:PAS domain S-box-containing protein